MNTHDSNTAQIKTLLLAGEAVAPFFYGVAIVQMFMRPGFDIRLHAISVLSLGEWGWIQVANFIITGVLALLGARGVRAVLRGDKAGTWGPLLIGTFGIGLILGGLFRPDPGRGFPPGAPAEIPTTMSLHATVHTLAFFVAMLSLIAVSFVFARRFASQRRLGWTAYCVASGILAPIFIMLGSTNVDLVGLLIAIGGAFAFGLVSVMAVQLRSELPNASPALAQLTMTTTAR